MMTVNRSLILATVLSAAALSAGCSTGPVSHGKAKLKPTDSVQAERAELTPEDRALVEAQEWCVVQNDEALGSMGPPVKLTIEDQTVFLCCKGCRKRAEENPDATLAKLEELKAKKAQGTTK